MQEAHSQSLCPICLRVIDAIYERDGGAVYLRKNCPQHGTFRTHVWQDGEGLPAFGTWRSKNRIPAYPSQPHTPVRDGCPYDCGLCPEHTQHTCTGLIEVTQRCSLACPVCYACAGATPAPDPDLAHIAAQLDALFAASGACNVQLSGGEPTERDDLPAIIDMAKARGFALVQINSNGLRLAHEHGYAATLKAAGLDSVYMQFDGTDDTVYERLRGRPLWAAKQAAVAACADAGLGVVLVCTLVPGINDHALGELLRWAVRGGTHIRGLHVQPVSSFGRFPWAIADAPRITLSQVMLLFEQQSHGLIKAGHFHPPACEHPLCSCSAVYAREGHVLSANPIGASCCTGGTSVTAPPPFAMPDNAMRNASDNAEGSRKAKRFVATHWASPASVADEAPSAIHTSDTVPMQTARVRALSEDFAGFVARSGSHKRFTVSAMAFQDAYTLDIERVRGCCIHVVSPDMRLIPFCLYNLTAQGGNALYRGRCASSPTQREDAGS